MTLWWVAVGWAAPATLAEAVEAGVLPDRHGPYVDCQCAALEWDQDVLRVPKSEILRFELAETPEGPVRLLLIGRGGERLVLEEAPCVFADNIASRYSVLLGVELTRVGPGAECSDPMASVEQWEKQREEPFVGVASAGLGFAMAGVTVEVKGDRDGQLGAAGEAAFAGQGPRLGQCWTLDDAAQQRVVSAKAVSGAPMTKLKLTGSSGSQVVDECLLHALEVMPLDLGVARGVRLEIGLN